MHEILCPTCTDTNSCAKVALARPRGCRDSENIAHSTLCICEIAGVFPSQAVLDISLKKKF